MKESANPNSEYENQKLRPGDIILFKAPSPNDIVKLSMSVRLIMGGQMLSSAFGRSKGGHYDTTHTSICSGYDEEGNLLITHFTGAKNGSETVKLESFMAQQDRSYLIFSPKDPHKRDEIVAETLKQEYTTQRYSYIGTLLSIFKRKGVVAKDKREEDTFCSAFVAKVLRFVGIDLLLGRQCTPKALEASLRKSDQFSTGYYLGKGGADEIINKVNIEVSRLEKGNTDSIKKAHLLKLKIKEITTNPSFQTLPEVGKAKLILQATLPIFAVHRNKGPSLFKPSSYRNIKGLAVRKGFSTTELLDQIQKLKPIYKPNPSETTLKPQKKSRSRSF